jgi:hypothetical protein
MLFSSIPLLAWQQEIRQKGKEEKLPNLSVYESNRDQVVLF